MRAVAVLMVSVVHFTVLGVVVGDAKLYPFGNFFAGYFAILSQGRLGVELFFLISGFVITLTLQSSASLKDFWTKRAIRLWVPVALLLPVVYLVANISPVFQFSSRSISDLAFSFTLIDPSLINAFVGTPHLFHPTTSVTWTLWIELEFYLIASLAYFSSKAFMKTLTIVAIPMFCIAVLSRTHFWLPLLNNQPGRAVVSLLGIAQFFPWFLAGVCAHELRFKEHIARSLYLTLYASCWAATCISEFSDENYMWYFAINLAIFCLFATIIRERKSGILRWGPLVKIGEVSYEYYLVHEALGISCIWWLGKAIGTTSPWLSVAPLLLILPASFLVFAFWSKPIMRIARKTFLKAQKR